MYMSSSIPSGNILQGPDIWEHKYSMNVDRHMPEFSAYLGHARVSDTYWYLSAVPELMQLAAMRLEQTQKGILP